MTILPSPGGTSFGLNASVIALPPEVRGWSGSKHSATLNLVLLYYAAIWSAASLSFVHPGAGGQHGLLLVHAHPDDESIGTGATMAKYAAEGVPVTLVTCTLGELGEIIPAELAAACTALGVSDHRFLGGPGRWRDSGMAGLPDNDAPDCFWQADVAEAAADLAVIIRETRPRVVVSYDENGFYGHPDHIQAHRVASRGARLAADPAAAVTGEPWRVTKFSRPPCRARWPRLTAAGS